MKSPLFLAHIIWSAAASSTGSCDSSDRAVWIGNSDFSSNIGQFAVPAFERTSAVVKRLTAAYPSLSVECAECFGAAVVCGTNNCLVPCLRSSASKECVSCSQQYCTPDLMKCVGVTDESDLPLPPSPSADADAAGSTTARPPRTRTMFAVASTAASDDFAEIVAIVFGEGMTDDDLGYEADDESDSRTTISV